MFLRLDNNLVQYLFLSILFLCVVNARKRIYLCNTLTDDDYSSKPFIGGKSTDITSYPMMAAIVAKKGGLLIEDILQCGCGIVAVRWVITAAHCIAFLVDQEFGVNDVYVSAGHKDWRKGYKHNVTHMIIHEHYNSDSMENDIALIHLNNSFNTKFEVPWPLASENYPYKPNTLVTVLGWGLRNPSADLPQNNLEFVKIHILDKNQCRDEYAKQDESVTDTQFCASEMKEGNDACQSNSGGSLIDDTILIGIASWGISCGEKESPGVYTKVSLYENWIVEKSKEVKDIIITECKTAEGDGDQFDSSESITSSFNKKMLVISQILFICYLYKAVIYEILA